VSFVWLANIYVVHVQWKTLWNALSSVLSAYSPWLTRGGGSMRRGQHTCRPGPTYLFSPRGMHAPRAVCSACVNFFLFLINLWAKITLDVLDQFSPLSDDLWAVGMATNFRVKIGKIRPFTFIRSRGILKQIAISPFWFLKQVYLHESAMIRLDYV